MNEHFIETLKDLDEKSLFIFDEFDRNQKTRKFNVENLIDYIKNLNNSNWKFTKIPNDSKAEKIEISNSRNNFAQQQDLRFDFQIYVGKLSNDVDMKQLKQLFENYGKLNYFLFKNDPITGQRRNFGFVGYSSFLVGNSVVKNVFIFFFNLCN